jgi:hypothetical protein
LENGKNSDFEKIVFKSRRKRKLKTEVTRNFECPIVDCDKSYGSENSVNQHIKLKHPEIWKTYKEKRSKVSEQSSVESKNNKDVREMDEH